MMEFEGFGYWTWVINVLVDFILTGLNVMAMLGWRDWLGWFG